VVCLLLGPFRALDESAGRVEDVGDLVEGQRVQIGADPDDVPAVKQENCVIKDTEHVVGVKVARQGVPARHGQLGLVVVSARGGGQGQHGFSSFKNLPRGLVLVVVVQVGRLEVHDEAAAGLGQLVGV